MYPSITFPDTVIGVEEVHVVVEPEPEVELVEDVDELDELDDGLLTQNPTPMPKVEVPKEAYPLFESAFVVPAVRGL